MTRIGVFIVDDSATVRRAMQELLSQDPSIEVIGTALDPIFALDKFEQRWPDVIVLDIEMPRMDGVTFLRKLMAEHPTPVIVCSTLTTRGAQITMQALAAGALAVVEKPKIGVRDFLQNASADLKHAIKAAARANLRTLGAAPSSAASAPASTPPRASRAAEGPAGPLRETTERVVTIGTSTGGTQALERVLAQLPRDCPGVAVVQHMPEKFTAAFAQRLDSLCQVDVREARHGDRLLRGHALVAPGGKHMLVKRSGAYYHVEVMDGPPVSRHRPSVDVLFRSTARWAGSNALGIIMTGMGNDGAAGMREMHEAGALTVAQDEESCVVFGMPKEAIRMGGVSKVVSLSQISQEIIDFGAA